MNAVSALLDEKIINFYNAFSNSTPCARGRFNP
jgi:hypothetical protein